MSGIQYNHEKCDICKKEFGECQVMTHEEKRVHFWCLYQLKNGPIEIIQHPLDGREPQ